MRVTVNVNNCSRRSVQPNFVLYEKKTFFGANRSKVETREILRANAEAVDSYSGKKTVTKVITIPKQLPPSILNCTLVKLEYKLKASVISRFYYDNVYFMNAAITYLLFIVKKKVFSTYF